MMASVVSHILFISKYKFFTSKYCLPLRTTSEITMMMISYDTYLSSPCAEQTDADFAVLVEIGVETIVAVGDVVEVGWHVGILVWQMHIKEEQPVVVGCLCRPHNHHCEQVLLADNTHCLL